MTRVRSMRKVKIKGQGHKRSHPNLIVSGPELQFEFTNDNEMMHKAFQGHTCTAQRNRRI